VWGCQGGRSAARGGETGRGKRFSLEILDSTTRRIKKKKAENRRAGTEDTKSREGHVETLGRASVQKKGKGKGGIY